ncbi:hypothetical protein [Corynebacterium variabile]|uniref:hypothetical protein n=1 Tax=Corynebacterium variabile TaxID=1727 RepID=UPI003FD68A3C
MTDSAAAVGAALRASSARHGDHPVTLRVPTDPDLPLVRYEVMPGPLIGPGARPLTVVVQVYAGDNTQAAAISELLFSDLDGHTDDDLVSVTGLTSPAPAFDPDRPELTRWQFTLSAVHTTA